MKLREYKFVLLQFLRFGLVGVLNNIIYLFFYYILININMNYIIANTGAYLISVFNAFYWNKKFVFKVNEVGTKFILRTYISYGITYFVSTGILFLGTDILSLNKYIAPLFSLSITIPINFLLNRFWTFKLTSKY